MHQPDVEITSIAMQPLTATASFWGGLAGLLLSIPRVTRPVGASLLMLVGYGGVGVAWERTTGCDLRRLQRPPRIAVSGTITHLPLAVLGHALLHTVGNGQSKKETVTRQRVTFIRGHRPAWMTPVVPLGAK